MQDTIEVYGRGIETEVKLLQGDPAELDPAHLARKSTRTSS